MGAPSRCTLFHLSLQGCLNFFPLIGPGRGLVLLRK